jgi:high-affinity iron transporter
VSFVDGKVSIPLKQVYDGELHRFEANEGGVEVRFWLYQKPDGKVATLFDACEICGPVGFYKNKQGVICKNCAAQMNPQSIGMPGRLQSDSAESAGHRRCGHRLRSRHRGGTTLLRAK